MVDEILRALVDAAVLVLLGFVAAFGRALISHIKDKKTRDVLSHAFDTGIRSAEEMARRQRKTLGVRVSGLDKRHAALDAARQILGKNMPDDETAGTLLDARLTALRPELCAGNGIAKDEPLWPRLGGTDPTNLMDMDMDKDKETTP